MQTPNRDRKKCRLGNKLTGDVSSQKSLRADSTESQLSSILGYKIKREEKNRLFPSLILLYAYPKCFLFTEFIKTKRICYCLCTWQWSQKIWVVWSHSDEGLKLKLARLERKCCESRDNASMILKKALTHVKQVFSIFKHPPEYKVRMLQHFHLCMKPQQSLWSVERGVKLNGAWDSRFLLRHATLQIKMVYGWANLVKAWSLNPKQCMWTHPLFFPRRAGDELKTRVISLRFCLFFAFAGFTWLAMRATKTNSCSSLCCCFNLFLARFI